MLTNEAVAKICHQTNKAYCESIGDLSQFEWDEAPQWQRDSSVKGVEFCRANPSAPAEANHDSWLEEKRVTGWKYGSIKDAEKKEHPCFVPYNQLPEEQKAKDALFKSIVRDLTPEVIDTPVARTKQLRRDLDTPLQTLKDAMSVNPTAERMLAIRKLQECIMWLGMDLKA